MVCIKQNFEKLILMQRELYSKTCLNPTSSGLKILFGFGRCSILLGQNTYNLIWECLRTYLVDIGFLFMQDSV